ncbi:MAG: ParB/RepB/Spo0J family partition protein [Opitutaceae bacterium]|nr:ParB/RepB/Spo0J family partition protein [Opitutaceae bacterium]
MASSKSRLGRGLGALISRGGKAVREEGKPQNPITSSSGSKSKPSGNTKGKKASKTAVKVEPSQPDSLEGFKEIAVSNVQPNPFQPRRDFAPDHLSELAESIRAEGLLQPIVVREVDDGYQLIAGERRWRAFQQLKLKKIPARVISAGDFSSASMALIENLQRESLNPIEEAQGYASLIRDFDLTQESVSERVGKGRASVANSLRLLQLTEEILGYLSSGLLSTGHAKVILGVETKQEQLLLARRVIEDGLSVRATEKLVQNLKKGRSFSSSKGRVLAEEDRVVIEDIQKRFSSHLNAKVELKHSPKKGKILIEYQGNEDLQRILERLGVPD